VAHSNELYTHLSLSRFASIFGLAPVHFAGASGSSIFPLGEPCGDVWQQHAWQNNDIISREDIAQAIYDAETDIANVLGYPVAPEYITAESHAWAKFYDRSVISASGAVRGESKSVPTRYGKVVEVGRRALSLIDADATVTYSDPDEDDWNELATITASTSLTSTDGIKLYTAGKAGDPRWEIRPILSKSISGSTLTITLKSWLLIDPELWEAYPTTTEAPTPIDIEDPDTFVTTVDIYREYTDSTNYPAQFTWNASTTGYFCSTCNGLGCPSCTPTTQNGCLQIKDTDRGFVIPTPATYASGWTVGAWSIARDPDSVKLWYQAGNRSEGFLAGLDNDPLDQYLAQAIAWLAIARLEAPPCGCGRVQAQFEYLRRDVSEVDRTRAVIISVIGPEMVTNPFGTRQGEVRAWNRIARIVGNAEWKGGAV
jgi:hypothetical protein